METAKPPGGFTIQEANEHVTKSHRPDCPIVVPLLGGSTDQDDAAPFAAILALDPGAKIAAAPRLCIHVGWSDGQFWFADGVFAVRDKYPLILSTVEFPELCKALRKDRREWSRLLNFKRGQKPHLHVKNLQEGDISLTLKEEQLGAAEFLRAMLKWNTWEQEGADWRSRLMEIREQPKDKKQAEIDKDANTFQAKCNSLGLRKGTRLDRDDSLDRLSDCLRVAMKVWMSDLGWDRIPAVRF